MADNAEDFVIRLSDQVSGPAQAAASAVGTLEQQIAQGADAVREMEAQMRILKGAHTQDASAVSDLSAKIGAQKDALAQAQSAYLDMGGSAQDALDIAKNGAEALATAEDDAATSATEAAAAQADFGGAAEEAGDSASGGAMNFRAMAGASRMLGGEVGSVAAKGLRLTQMFMKMGPEVAAVIVALAAMAAGIAAFVGVIHKGIEAAGAYRDEMLKLAGNLGGSVSAAKELQGAITAVSTASALSRDKVADYAGQLAKAKLTGGELQRALEAMSIAGSAGGDEMASSFLKTVESAKASGASVDNLSAKMKAKLGGVAAAQALSLGVQFDKLKENITGIFSGADIEPLLQGIHSLLSIFDQTTASGQALKATVSGFINAAIGGFLRTAIAAVQMYIWIRKHETAWQLVKAAVTAVAIVVGLLSAALLIAVAAVAATAAMLAAPFVLTWAAVVYLWGRLQAFWAWASSLTWSSIGNAISATLTKAAQPVVQLWGLLQAFWTWVKSITWQDVGFAIGTAIGLAVLPVVRLWGGLKTLWAWAKSITWADVGNAIGGAFDAAAAPVLRIWGNVQALWTQITSIDWSSIGTAITAPFEAAFAWLRSISLADIGVNMMLGLANGITSAASAVLSAITGVMSGAVAGAKAALGIASPSRLMRDEVGYQMGAGTAVGVDDSAAEVADSTKAMARGAVDAASPNGALVKGGVSSGAGTSFTFTNCAFGGDLTPEKLEEWLVGILHRNTLSAEPAT